MKSQKQQTVWAQNEDWDLLLDLDPAFQEPHQQNFGNAKDFLLRGSRRFKTGGIALRPVRGNVAPKGPGIFKAENFTCMVVTPYRNSLCPSSKSGRKVRLQAADLVFGTDADGRPAYYTVPSCLQVDLAKNPRKACQEFEAQTFDPDSLGGQIEAATGHAERKLQAQLSGEITVVKSEQWCDVVRNAGHRHPSRAVLYRFKREDEMRIKVREGYVRAGDTVVTLDGFIEYGKARISTECIPLMRRSSPDVLTLSGTGKNAADFACRAFNGVVARMLDAEQPLAVRDTEAVSLSKSMPTMMAHIKMPSYRRLGACAGFELTSAAKAFIMAEMGYALWDTLESELADEMGDIIEGFLASVTVEACEDWAEEGFLIAREYLPDAMLKSVDDWYLDMRGAYSFMRDGEKVVVDNGYAEIDEYGTVYLPPFPRMDEENFLFDVRGLTIDATPHSSLFCPPQSNSKQGAAEMATV